MRCWRKSVALSLVSSLLMGCVAALPPLPPVPREPVDRIKAAVSEVTGQPAPEPLPPRVESRPPADLACSQSGEDPTLWLCVGDPARMGQGTGLFFAYDGPAEDLRKLLASERILRELVVVLRERMQVRDQLLVGTVGALEAMTAIADEHRVIAVIRGEEITRLQRDRIIDRFTLMIPVFGLAAGIVYVLVR